MEKALTELEHPFLACTDPDVAELLGTLLGEYWPISVLSIFEGLELFVHEHPNTVVITRLNSNQKFDFWSKENIALLQWLNEGDDLIFEHVQDWVHALMPKEELELRILKASKTVQEKNRHLEELNRMIEGRKVQNLMNDRLIKVSLELKQAKEQIERLSLTDALTGVNNRRFLDEYLAKEITQATRYRNDLSFCMVDIDDFKRLNDTYGHPAGDEVLIQFAQVIRNNLRDTDWMARYGGEEFSIVFPQTDLRGALHSAERLCQKIRNKVLDPSGKAVTVSVGVSHFSSEMTQAQLINYADLALYHCKKTGKNKVAYHCFAENEIREPSSFEFKPDPPSK